MTQRVINFNPGPCALPLPAIEAAQAELCDFQGTGMSIMEISHRSKEYEAVHNEAKSLILQLLELSPSDWEVLFLGGGASTQFCMVPYNFLDEGKSADYVITGVWSQKALKEAKILAPGRARVAGTAEPEFNSIPRFKDLDIDPKAAYLHITSNNTIYGTEWPTLPVQSPVPIIVDMSSDFMARRFSAESMDLIYAGAQKNAGPAGVTIVLLRKSALDKCRKGIPTMLSYRTHAQDNSLFNTPPCFAIYMVRNVMRWAVSQGGLDGIEAANRRKAQILYGFLDQHADIFKPHARPEARSMMNVTFRLTSEEAEARLVSEAKKAGFIGLKGHRSVGGIRVSMYNAISVQNIESLVGFMEEFIKTL